MLIAILVININGNIMQLDSTINNASPILIDSPATTSIVEQVRQQNNLMVCHYIWLCYLNKKLLILKLPSNRSDTIQFKQIPSTPEPLEEEPLYVNAKQYKRIMIRRQARAKLEAEGRIPKNRLVYNIFYLE